MTQQQKENARALLDMCSCLPITESIELLNQLKEEDPIVWKVVKKHLKAA